MTADVRDALARLICGDAWYDTMGGEPIEIGRRQESFDIADAVLSSGLVVPAGALGVERAKWLRAHTLWSESAAAERDAAHAAIREWSSAVDMFQRSFTVETSSRLLAAEDALRALLPPVAAPIGEEAGE